MSQATRDRAVATMRAIQDQIIAGLEGIEAELGSDVRFIEDVWEREGGGGGRTKVIANGSFLEKGGVNTSVVFGEFSPEYAKQVPGSGTSFFATGVSLVLHPKNPHVPTVHANFRHLEHGNKAWFGGGADLTPYYHHADDEAHFHSVWKDVCEAHEGVADYPAFRNWCDAYFYLSHRKERRGIGGIFFDYLWVDENEEGRWNAVHDFVADAGSRFLDSYLPIAKRWLHEPYTPEQRRWQELRRGRYVEFNLIHDRGTVFGLKTGGRTESILMSLPPHVQWGYMATPEPGTPEAALVERLSQPPPEKPEIANPHRNG